LKKILILILFVVGIIFNSIYAYFQSEKDAALLNISNCQVMTLIRNLNYNYVKEKAYAPEKYWLDSVDFMRINGDCSEELKVSESQLIDASSARIVYERITSNEIKLTRLSGDEGNVLFFGNTLTSKDGVLIYKGQNMIPKKDWNNKRSLHERLIFSKN
jgi:hypothetical protein